MLHIQVVKLIFAKILKCTCHLQFPCKISFQHLFNCFGIGIYELYFFFPNKSLKERFLRVIKNDIIASNFVHFEYVVTPFSCLFFQQGLLKGIAFISLKKGSLFQKNIYEIQLELFFSSSFTTSVHTGKIILVYVHLQYYWSLI